MATTAPAATTVTPSSEQSSLSDWAGKYVTNLLGKTEALAESPYQVYGGPMTAGQSGLQSKVFQGLGNLTYPSLLGKSFAGEAPTIGADGKPTGATSGIAGQYMNPYIMQALNPQLDELRRQSAITQKNNALNLIGQGAFGGSAQAIKDAELQRNLMQEMNKTVGQGYANAYDKAMGQFNQEQNQAKTLSDLMSSEGANQRNIEQQGITADLNEFNTQRDYPQKMLQLQQSMLQGLPISTTSTIPAAQSGIGALSSNVGMLTQLSDALAKLGIKIG